MDKSKVSVTRCDSYNRETLGPALDTCLDALGNFKDIIKPDKKILLKPNLLSPNDPERAITTHPLFVEAVIKKIVEITNQPENIMLADSCVPVLKYNEKGLKKLYEATGMIDLPEKTGISLNYENSCSKVSAPDGVLVKQIEVIKPVADADIIINLPKFKTHNLTVITGAVKNMFGIIPGMSKPGLHARFFDISMFCNLLIDIVTAVKPHLSIMDGILGMEGDGPGRKGTPRKTGLILAGTDCFAIDNIMAAVMGVNEDNNPVLIEAKKRNIKGTYLENIELTGGTVSDFRIADFILPVSAKKDTKENFITRAVKRIAKDSLNPYPKINKKKCKGRTCKSCKKICPQSAISDSAKDKDALIFDYKKCIRCFCCSEACPEGAIGSEYTFIGNLIVKKYGFGSSKKQT